MKKRNFKYKTIQLILFILMTVFWLYIVLFDSRMYHLAASDPQVRLLCMLLWLILALSFLFIFVDYTFFSSYKKDYHEMESAARSDPLSGLSNRFCCDIMIEKYLDKPLPDNIGCIMFDLTCIKDINQKYGHTQGNMVIRDFAGILKDASSDLCFVGRNGGNKFMALFENCSRKKMDLFLDRISQHVQLYNDSPNKMTISYDYGIAFEEEEVNTITDLISLSNRRIYE